MKNTRKFRRFKRYEFTALTGLVRIPKHDDLRRLPFMMVTREVSVEELMAAYRSPNERLEAACQLMDHRLTANPAQVAAIGSLEVHQLWRGRR